MRPLDESDAARAGALDRRARAGGGAAPGPSLRRSARRSIALEASLDHRYDLADRPERQVVLAVVAVQQADGAGADDDRQDRGDARLLPVEVLGDLGVEAALGEPDEERTLELAGAREGAGQVERDADAGDPRRGRARTGGGARPSARSPWTTKSAA